MRAALWLGLLIYALVLAGLATLNGALLGAMTTEWPALAERLAALSLLSAEDVERVRHLWWYGRLIANTDMHLGNLGFRPAGILRLAPTYDMVPMLYAPLAGGEFVTKPLIFQGRALELNVSTSAAGSVRWELQDAEGHPIPGFTLAENPEIFGDAIAPHGSRYRARRNDDLIHPVPRTA